MHLHTLLLVPFLIGVCSARQAKLLWNTSTATTTVYTATATAAIAHTEICYTTTLANMATCDTTTLSRRKRSVIDTLGETEADWRALLPSKVEASAEETKSLDSSINEGDGLERFKRFAIMYVETSTVNATTTITSTTNVVTSSVTFASVLADGNAVNNIFVDADGAGAGTAGCLPGEIVSDLTLCGT